jgi:hypothetical protein
MEEPVSGYISQDGHIYKCKNPAEMQRSFHMYVLFVVDVRD